MRPHDASRSGADDGFGPGAGPEDRSAVIDALRARLRDYELGGRGRGEPEGGTRRDGPSGDRFSANGPDDRRGDGARHDGAREPGGNQRHGRGRPEERGRGKRRSAGTPGDSEAFAGAAGGAEPDADPEAVARAICLRLLTMAPKTRAQLAGELRKRGVPEAAAQAVLDRLSDAGLIDDEAFAATWVSSRHVGRGLARRALAQELRDRGVAEETLRRAVDRLDPEQEVETARGLVTRRLAATRGLDPRTRARRLIGTLVRKGYPSGLAFRIVREALEAEGLDVEDLPEDPD